MEANQKHPTFTVSRKVYSEKIFVEDYPPRDKSSHEEKTCRERTKKVVERVSSGLCCYRRKMEWLRKRCPIVEWLPKYSPKQDGIADLVGGLTVGIMHVPQGLAFAMLASLPPVTGLYTSLIPVLIYMFMGTSRQLSQGAFPVVCMMIAQVVNREVSKSNDLQATYNSTANPTSLESVWSPYEAKKLEIAVTLALIIGFIQAAMGFLRCGFIASYLSDPVVSGFTTGAATVIVISQIIPILGLNIPPAIGFFSSIKMIISMCRNLTGSNVGSIITGVLCIVILIGLKEVNQRYSKKLPFPIPAELIVVILSTGISYGVQLHSRFGIQIVKNIPKGIPSISIPSFTLMSDIYSDAFKIAIVIFATNISVAKLFAKKNGQKVDCDQELISYGACNIGVAFFSGFPVSVALARVVVQANLARTQLCSIPVIGILLLVLLFIAHLFYHLPKAVLSAIVIANLLNMLKQYARIKQLWLICKADAVVWCVTCFGVMLLGIDVGLGSGVFAALLSVVLRSSKPRYSILGNIPYTDIYRNIKTNSKVKEIYGIKIVRFEASLYYANVEYFKDILHLITSIDSSKDIDIMDVVVDRSNSVSSKTIKHPNEEQCGLMTNGTKNYSSGVLTSSSIHTLIIDGSTFTCIDSMGIETLRLTLQEFNRRGVQLYLANCSNYLIKQLTNSKDGNLIDVMFVSIHDAVLHSELKISQQLVETRC